MKEIYLASPEKIGLSIEIAKRERELLRDIDYKNGYSLYIGIPFCPTTCLYCSFTSYPVAKWAPRMDEYLDALFQEIDYAKEAFRAASWIPFISAAARPPRWSPVIWSGCSPGWRRASTFPP